ncbi:hypothetical protein EST38_g12003 [Candolleomyces aberdarensis]|uniref:Uncharacterized protein n=1 Tax=Candolleomyces aberdarensis TaxID=2316362 RepID=A0A4Q2D6S0_9AGAR|nr:hypothetical protein EST38_g12003 [Candolleomyces aberdarensis]
MPPCRLPLPSFSLVLTAANGDPLLKMQDFNPAPTSVQINLQLPQLSAIMTAPTLLQPSDRDPLMQTIDTRFQGQLAYQARYATDAGKPSGEDDDNQSETGTMYEPSPVGLAHELHVLGQSGRTRRPRRLPTRSRSPSLLNRLHMKFSAFWRKLRRLGASILCGRV